MKFLLTYSQSPTAPPTTPAQYAALGAFTEQYVRSGVVLMTGGLVRPTKGIQVVCADGKVTVTDGPFAETKELIDGFALIEVPSREDALRLATDFMTIAGDGNGEILQVFDGPPPA